MDTPCTHPKAFYALAHGCRVREATQEEVVAWAAAQRHPLFSIGAGPNWLVFDSNIRMGEVVIAYETVCYCPSNQPHMD